jgi:hypothetical protein
VGRPRTIVTLSSSARSGCPVRSATTLIGAAGGSSLKVQGAQPGRTADSLAE